MADRAKGNGRAVRNTLEAAGGARRTLKVGTLEDDFSGESGSSLLEFLEYNLSTILVANEESSQEVSKFK